MAQDSMNFVGRRRELRLLETALDADQWPFRTLFVCGPPGIGKRTLLDAYTRVLAERAIPHCTLAWDDCSDPSEAVRSCFEALPIDSDTLSPSERSVLLVKGFRERTDAQPGSFARVVEALPPSCLTILTCSRPPPLGWLVRQWERSARVVVLPPLSGADARRLLMALDVPRHLHDDFVEFAGGHPFTLRLLASCVQIMPDRSFEEIRAHASHLMLEWVAPDLLDAPAEERYVLEAVALMRRSTEGLLEELFPDIETRALFRRLTMHPSMRRDVCGVVPLRHIRNALATEFAWRNPRRNRRLRARIARVLRQRFDHATSDDERLIALLDLLYLGIDLARARTVLSFRGIQGYNYTPIDPGSERLESLLQDAVDSTERKELEGWIWHRATRVLGASRLDARTLDGAVIVLEADADELAALPVGDPRIDATREALESEVPLRADERVRIVLSLVIRPHDQMTTVVTGLGAVLLLEALTCDPLALTGIVLVDGTEMVEVARAMGYEVLRGSRVTARSLRYVTVVQDWRRMRPEAWLGHLVEGRFCLGNQLVSSSPELPRAKILPRDAFVDAVRDALRSLHSDKALQENPLLTSRIVFDRGGVTAGPAERARILRQVLLDVHERLRSTPHGEKYQLVVEHTYVDPAETQEQAAEELDLPISTYRRHLRRGIEDLCDALWRTETAGGGE